MDIGSFKRLSGKLDYLLTKQIFFVVGPQKGGTTWVQKILDNHPEVICSGEGHFADKMGASLSQFKGAYDKFLELVAVDVYEGKPSYRPINIEEFEFIMLSWALFMMGCQEVDDSIKAIGDKTPMNSLFMVDFQRIFPGAKFIHITRDGRDAVTSNLKAAHHLSQEKHGKILDRYSLDNKIEEYTTKWAKYLNYALGFEQKHPDQVYRFKYEDLKEDKGDIVKGMFDFLDVSSDKKIVQHCIDEASFKKMSGGRKPGEEDARAFIRKGIVGDWKENFEDRHLKEFNKIAGQIMKHLGYST